MLRGVQKSTLVTIILKKNLSFDLAGGLLLKSTLQKGESREEELIIRVLY